MWWDRTASYGAADWLGLAWQVKEHNMRLQRSLSQKVELLATTQEQFTEAQQGLKEYEARLFESAKNLEAKQRQLHELEDISMEQRESMARQEQMLKQKAEMVERLSNEVAKLRVSSSDADKNELRKVCVAT
jgi:hypothetical protein